MTSDLIARVGAGDVGAVPDLQILADEMAQVIGLESAPVAVFLLAPDADLAPFAGWEAVERHRYCQALMKARGGERVVLEADELACPAAAKAFGFKALPPALQTGKVGDTVPIGAPVVNFKALPPALQTGKGLVGFGIVAEPGNSAATISGMACLEPGTVARLPLCPPGRGAGTTGRGGRRGTAGAGHVAVTG